MQGDRGIIYGLVGVIGSGKSYRAEQIQIDSKAEDRPCIVGDFSEGIRQTLMNIFTGHDVTIDVTSREYSYWKNLDFNVPIPAQKDEKISGRLLLQRCGEYLKNLAGKSVWADWTLNDITNKLMGLSSEEAVRANIVFGSLRFLDEAKNVLLLGKLTKKEVRIIFCDYKSGSYELNDHESEKLARYFVTDGYKDGDDITDVIIKLIEDEGFSKILGQKFDGLQTHLGICC